MGDGAWAAEPADVEATVAGLQVGFLGLALKPVEVVQNQLWGMVLVAEEGPFEGHLLVSGHQIPLLDVEAMYRYV